MNFFNDTLRQYIRSENVGVFYSQDAGVSPLSTKKMSAALPLGRFETYAFAPPCERASHLCHI